VLNVLYDDIDHDNRDNPNACSISHLLYQMFMIASHMTTTSILVKGDWYQNLVTHTHDSSRCNVSLHSICFFTFFFSELLNCLSQALTYDTVYIQVLAINQNHCITHCRVKSSLIIRIYLSLSQLKFAYWDFKYSSQAEYCHDKYEFDSADAVCESSSALHSSLADLTLLSRHYNR